MVDSSRPSGHLPRIANYLGGQLGLPPVLRVRVPQREATALEHRQHILRYLGFHKFDEGVQGALLTWLTQQAQLGGAPRGVISASGAVFVRARV